MALDTYTDLIDSLEKQSDRTDLADRWAVFIRLAEAEFNRTIWTPDTEEDATITASGATASLPADFRALRSIYIDSDPRVVPEQMALSELRWRHSAQTTGAIQNFAIKAGNTLVFGPTPDTSYSLPIVYYAKIPALTEAAPTNWLLTDHPDIYFFGAMLQANIEMDNPTLIQVYQGKLGYAIAQLETAGHKKAYGSTPQRIRSAYVV